MFLRLCRSGAVRVCQWRFLLTQDPAAASASRSCDRQWVQELHSYSQDQFERESLPELCRPVASSSLPLQKVRALHLAPVSPWLLAKLLIQATESASVWCFHHS